MMSHVRARLINGLCRGLTDINRFGPTQLVVLNRIRSVNLIPESRLSLWLMVDSVFSIFDIIPGMTKTEETDASTLCRSCGLCCTGHLFSWAKLKSNELTSARGLGLNVFGSEPSQRGFSQPCPLWEGECTVYTSPHYPHACGTYKCKLFKEVLDETIPLSNALIVIQQTKEMIAELEIFLPASSNISFRERLVARIEHLEESAKQENADLEFQQRAHELLIYYKKYFGVKDLVDEFGER